MQLIVQSGSDAGKSFNLDSQLVVLGRQVGCDILLNDSQISRRHAQFENRNGTIFIIDLGSANGSYVNNQRLTPNTLRALQPGDNIKIGDSSMQFAATVAPTQMAMPRAPMQPPVYPAQPQAYQPYSVPPVQPQPQAYQPQAYQPQAYQPYAPAPAPKKKGGGGIIVLIVALLVLVGGGAAAGFFILNGNKDNTPTSGGTAISNTTASGVTGIANTTGGANNTTRAVTTAIIATTVATGASGTNAPPPSPAPSTVAGGATTAPIVRVTTVASVGGSGGTVNNFGVSVTFPDDWKTSSREETNNVGTIQGISPDGAFVSILRFPGLGGDLTARADQFITAFKNQNSKLTVTVQPEVKRNGLVTFEVEYPNQNSQTYYEYILLTQNSNKDAYLIELGAEKSKFSSFENTFGDILDSLQFS
ncbi:FHA domain-containing protein [Candidatus Chlorohelix sp.]|uniref:FHA domain-containing protein n=1 Tax=Candidatus Chlorohelix sp. TaxID=3139201 RepID=UPI00302F45D3